MRIRRGKAVLTVRRFLWELLIIVLGVLIALSAQAWTEENAWQDRVAAARITMRAELQELVSNAQLRVDRSPCLVAYLERFEKLVERSSGTPLSIHYRYPAPITPWPSTAWTAAVESQAVVHMKQQEMFQYAALYSSSGHLGNWNLRERELMAEIRIDRPKVLTDARSDRLAVVIAQLHEINWLQTIVAEQLVGSAVKLGIRPVDQAQGEARTGKCYMPDHGPKA